ncbi:glycine cleavage system protein R [Alkalilimnicola ehrlichii MLHE-1]|uniref:Glycine cleavage system transcriptional repressor n=1 Tax=Alkalilimnicola ehrlichii (strain ATCC BAA-1101 / DSM 17681 / MLHE-1) TaxID=187272 RepID=Q0A5R8_ALKEH|nr:ACT domain-containing protein [Alkalilimnicola ehrlichii]ABI57819.1 amino acid-binding ACT domain protein [Alkalilimnicola ehrlichii MLHE-1]
MSSTDPAIANLLVITALGHDRPGLVSDLAAAVGDTGCNILDSRMSTLGCEFGIMMLVSGRWDELARLEAGLSGVGRRLGLVLQSRRTERPAATGQSLPYAAEVVGLDQPGIVSQLAGFFAQREINIRDLSTASYQAQHTGTRMATVQLTIDVPAALHLATVRDEFMEFCDQLNLDAMIEPLKQ